MYERIKKSKENKSRAVAQKKNDGKQDLWLLDNRSENITLSKLQQSANNRVLKHPSVMQGYFTFKGDNTLFGMRQVDEETISKVQKHLETHHPKLLETFLKIKLDNSSKGAVCLQDWLEKNGTSLKEVEFTSIQEKFPQTKEIPISWVSSTTAHNPGGPPLLLNPPELQSPTSSQEDEIAIEKSALKYTDLVIDITQDHFNYHRTKKDHPITQVNRSELRAGAALTNSFLDQSRNPLVGNGTETIKNETDTTRKKARKQYPAMSKGKIFSHHPDTFWTGKSHSEMGWHPVDKNTNTLEGDHHNLPLRTGKNLTGILLKEKQGYTRPTLESISSHENRCAAVREMIAEPSSELSLLRKKIDSAKKLATTKNAMARWSALEAVIERLEIAVKEDGPFPLGDLAKYYLEMTFDCLPPSTSAVNDLFKDIYYKLLDL